MSVPLSLPSIEPVLTKAFRRSARFLVIAVGSMTCTLAGKAGAEIVASDSFNSYDTGGPPTGERGGSGWVRPWSRGPDALVQVTDESLNYSADGLALGGGRSVRISGENTIRALTRQISQPEMLAGRDIYFRVLFKMDGGTGPIRTNSFSGWYFRGENTWGSDVNAVVVGQRQSAAARVGENSAQIPETLQYGVTYLLVGKVSGWSDEKDCYTRTTAWLNPDPSKPENRQIAEASVLGDTGTGFFERIALRVHNLQDDTLIVSDVLIGTEWADVFKPTQK